MSILNMPGFLHPLGLRHFYDGFSLRAEVSIRLSALEAFQLQEEFFFTRGGSVPRLGFVTCSCTRGWGGHQEQPVDQNAPEADRRNVPDDVISVSDSEGIRSRLLGKRVALQVAVLLVTARIVVTLSLRCLK